MKKREILDFINRNPVAYMATVDGNRPHVRAMRTYRAGENGIMFNMESPKDVYRELIANPEVELCYYANGIQVRVSGRMEQLTDLALKKEIVEDRPLFLAGLEKYGWDYVGIFILKHGKASVLKWPLPEPGAPKDYTDL